MTGCHSIGESSWRCEIILIVVIRVVAAEQCDKEVAAERAEYLFRASFARWPLSFISSSLILNIPSRSLSLHQSQTTTSLISTDRQISDRFDKDLHPHRPNRPTHHFSCPSVFVGRSTSFVEHRLQLPSHVPSQDDSRTSSSCQPSALDSAFRLFYTRGHQRCFRSLGLTATHQGPEDSHRSEGRDACSSTITDRGFLNPPSLIV
jgi:hypothetical protein